MEQFATEEQQVEAIKKFWKENGAAIVIGAVVGLGGLWGWRYYNETRIAEQEQASDAYVAVVESLEATDAESFISAHKDSGYAALTSMQLAKQAVDNNDLEGAAKHLATVANSDGEASLKAVANIRLARIQSELGQLDEALATLANVTEEAFEAQVQETKGDVYVKQSMFDKARAAYSAALEGNETNRLLKMKLDNLAAVANG